MARKQLAFRLDEEKFEKFQRYADMKNKTMQELLENYIDKILSGGALNIGLQRILEDAMNYRDEEIKEALVKSFKRSIYLGNYLGNQTDYVVQVIIDENGIIHEMENEKGWIPYNVREDRAYLLWEFESQDVHKLAFDIISLDGNTVLPALFENGFDNHPKLSYEDLANWLIKKKKAPDYDISDWEARDIVAEVAAADCPEFINLIRQWNPKAFGIVKLYIISLLEKSEYGDISYIHERVEEIWNEILSRPEIASLLH